MDDLLGEDWKAPPKPNPAAPPQSTSFNSNFSALRITPQPSSSNAGTPLNLSRPSSTVNGGKQNANDQFGSLLSLKSQKQGNNLSIQERQKQLLEERRRQQEQNSQLWDTLGSGRATPEVRKPSPATAPIDEDEDDILAAFNKKAPVDKASFFPPPSSGPASGRATPASSQSVPPASGGFDTFDDDDDPFGLGMAPAKTSGNSRTAAPIKSTMNDDDDILGDLGKPVSQRPPPKPQPPIQRNVSPPSSEGPDDQAVAELVDMGFPADNAKIALAESGGDVQRAVGWLLQQAHEESKQKARNDAENRRGSPNLSSRSPSRMDPNGHSNARSSSAARRQDSRSPANAEKDPGQMAQDFGSKLFKSANSLWKASQKQMAKTMSEFQQDRDPNQPKWMQESSAETSRASSQKRQVERPAPRRMVDTTDEAAMLDAPRESRAPKPTRAPVQENLHDLPSRGRSPLEDPPSRSSSNPRFMQQGPPPQDKRPATKLSRQAVEEQSAQAYVSPARRKKTTPKPEPAPEPEVDLFSPAPAAQPAAKNPTQVAPKPAPSPAPSRPKAPPRNIPSASPSALSTSSQHRKVGGEAFKRGDYASAHESYSAALSPLPATHPIAIIVLSNRSLTALKTGDAKMAVSDADRALEIIGVSQGVGETIDLGPSDGQKDMRDFYGKALMRKAEALEHMEKWNDAAAVWKQAIESGVGGAVSIRGRERCQKATAPKPAAPPKPAARAPARPAPAKSLGNGLQRPTPSSANSAEAVKKLRETNAAADKADDEKFALTDQVDARLTAWKGGKADNLRALLQSLDTVLWPEAGWKKVGMSDLVMANKVKIVYMKAIAKVHPDKVSQDATTEQRMISGSVFSTLNEAWDKFKKDNNL